MDATMKACSIVTLLLLAVSLPLLAAGPAADLALQPYFSADQPNQPRIISSIMPVKP
jgi:hypothetical protein